MDMYSVTLNSMVPRMSVTLYGIEQAILSGNSVTVYHLEVYSVYT